MYVTWQVLAVNPELMERRDIVRQNIYQENRDKTAGGLRHFVCADVVWKLIRNTNSLVDAFELWQDWKVRIEVF